MEEKFEIVYDYSNDYEDILNISEEFVGTWEELQSYIKLMREQGCYNITATALEW